MGDYHLDRVDGERGTSDRAARLERFRQLAKAHREFADDYIADDFLRQRLKREVQFFGLCIDPAIAEHAHRAGIKE